MAQACRLIEIWGAPRERGRRYGDAAATEVRRGTRSYLAQMARAGLTEAKLDELVTAYLPLIDAFDDSYVDEMRGIAEGADVPLAHVVLVNARTELLKLAGNPVLRAGLDQARGADGCTTVIVQPERAAENTLIHAHNWDWKASCAEDCVILRIRNDAGPDMLTFTEAGGLARFGFNAAGIAVTGNYLECERDYRRIGVPLALIRRKVLQQDNPSLAFAAAYTAEKSASNNLAITHAPTGIAHDLECAPDETFVVEPRNGLLVHANHWLSPIALTKLRDTGVGDSPCTYFRQQRAERLLAPIARIGLDDVREALCDTAGSPLSILVPPRFSAVTGRSATVAMLLMQPAKGVMDVAMMPSEGARFTRYALSAESAVAPELADAHA
jgi:isopenicillin-N N-acyltransferase like protein